MTKDNHKYAVIQYINCFDFKLKILKLKDNTSVISDSNSGELDLQNRETSGKENQKYETKIFGARSISLYKRYFEKLVAGKYLFALGPEN